jgi:hypothetical protein
VLDRLGKAIFSSNGISVLIAVIGVTSSIVGLFVDTNDTVSVKWLILMATVAGYFAVILIKIAHDAAGEKRPPPAFEHPIRYVPDARVFVIRSNEHFTLNTVVGCYSQKDGLDKLAYLGLVEHIQPKLIQIQILMDMQILSSVPYGTDDLKMLEIRPVVPFSALRKLAYEESYL